MKDAAPVAENSMAARSWRAPPKILEIGAVPFMWQAFRQTTEFYSSWHEETKSASEQGRYIISFSTLPRLVHRLADPSFDLVVVHAPSFRPWGGRALVRTLSRRSVLNGSFPGLRGFGAELLRFPVAAPIVILDLEDATTITRSNLFLLDKAVTHDIHETVMDLVKDVVQEAAEHAAVEGAKTVA